MATGCEDGSGISDRFAEISRDVGHCGEKEVAEAMAFQSFPGFETVLEEPRQQGFFLRQGNNAVANVTRRRNVKLLAQPPAGAAVVAYRHNGREIGDERK